MLATAPVCTFDARAHLERNPLVPQQRRQSTQLRGAIGSDGDVVDDPHAVAETVRVAERDGLVDGRQPERLTSMNCEPGVVVSHVLESIEMSGGWIAGLRTRDVESDNAPVAEPDRQLGDLQRPRLMPHRGDQASHHNGAALGAGSLLAVGEAGEHGIDDCVQGQAGVDVQLGREADLGVHDVVGCKVLDALIGHPVQGLGCLHHPDGVRERLQIAHQRSAVSSAVRKNDASPSTSVAGRSSIAVGLGQLEHGRRSQPAVEVVVKKRLGRLPDRLQRQRRHHVNLRS